MPKKSNAQQKQEGIPRSEWIMAAFGAALVLACIAILAHSGLTSEESPPRLSVRVVSIEASGEQFVVLLDVANEGGATAADAHIQAELRENGVVLERSEATVDFVPRRSRRNAGVFFRRDPRAHELSVRATGYREP